jgi:Flp pilus assembly protein TadD
VATALSNEILQQKGTKTPLECGLIGNGKAVRIYYHKKKGAGDRVACCARLRTSKRIRAARSLCRRLPGLLFGVWVSTGCLQADVCDQARDALQRRDLSAAEGLLKQCATANPTLLGPVLDLCGVYQAQGRGEDLVRTASEGIKRFPAERRFYLTVANYAGRSGQYERALEVFGEAHRRWPQDEQFKNGLASAHLYLGTQQLDKGQNAEAEQHLRQAVTLSEQDVDARLNLGRALHNLNRSVEAEEEFNRVIALDPKVPLARFHRGMVRQALGDLDAAIADLSEEIRQNPAYPPSYFSRGKAYQTKGLLNEALADLDVAVQKMPDNGRAVFARGRCRLQLGLVADAEADFRKAMSLEPDNPEPINALAQLLWRSGKKQEAELLFQQGREKGKASRTAQPGEIRFEGSTKPIRRTPVPQPTKTAEPAQAK